MAVETPLVRCHGGAFARHAHRRVMVMHGAARLVQAQAQCETDIQPRGVSQLQEAHIGGQRAHGFFGLQQRRFFHAIDLVQHHHVGALQLLAEQLRRRVAHGVPAGEGFLQQQRGIDHGQRGIQYEVRGQFRRLQYFHDGAGQGQA